MFEAGDEVFCLGRGRGKVTAVAEGGIDTKGELDMVEGIFL